MVLSKLNPRIWSTANGGLIRCVSLTQNRIDDAMALMRDYYYKEETLCKSLGIHEDPEAIAELQELDRRVLKVGISLIAEEVATGKIAAFAINCLYSKQDHENQKRSFGHCKNPKARAIQAIAAVEDEVDVLDRFGTDCVMELRYGVVLPEYRVKGLATMVSAACVELGRKLKNGENVKTSVDGTDLPLEPRPSVLISTTTGTGSRKVLEQLGFKKAEEINFYEKKALEGLFSFKVPPIPIMYKLL